MDIGNFLLWLIGITFVALTIGECVCHERLMDQCLADGKKEYECHAMLQSRSDYMPIIITK